MSAPIGEMAALAAAAAWAIGSTLFSRIGRDVSPFAMNLGKCLTAGVMLLGTYVIVRGPHVSAPIGSLGWLALSAIAGLTIGDTAYFNALVRLGVARAILLLSTAPVFAAIGAAVFLGEPLTLRSAIGICVTLAGITLTVGSSAPARAVDATSTIAEAPNRERTLAGIAFGLISGIGQASGSLLSKHAMQSGIDPLLTSSGRLLIGGLSLALISAARGSGRTVARELAKDRAWLRIAGAGFVGSYCGIWLSQIALAQTPSAGVASTLLATSPVFALPIAHLMGDEPIRARGVIGVLITVGGIGILASAA
jgi:drug/metabolite transporter (DMT)-like permease